MKSLKKYKSALWDLVLSIFLLFNVGLCFFSSGDQTTSLCAVVLLAYILLDRKLQRTEELQQAVLAIMVNQAAKDDLELRAKLDNPE